MSESSAFPIRQVFDVRQGKTADAGSLETAALPTVSPSGPRKLIRPRLPADAVPTRYPGRGAVSPLSRGNSPAAHSANTHAEAFYFQKQIHSQTPMIFVLEDGEQIEGTIDWYDLHSIKVKRGNLRTLIYKAGIKYLYKASEHNGTNGPL